MQIAGDFGKINNAHVVSRKTSFFTNCNFLLTILYLLWSQTPYFFREVPRVIVMGLIILWFLTALLSLLPRIKFQPIKVPLVIVTLLSWFVLVVIYVILQLPEFAFGNLYFIVLYYVPIFFFLYFSIKRNKRMIRTILIIQFISYSITIFFNLCILNQNPFAAKQITGHYGTDYPSLYSSNIISDIFIMDSILLACSVSVILVNTNKMIVRLLSFGYLMITAIFIVRATFFVGIIILLLFLIILLFLLISKTKGGVGKAIAMFFFLLAFLLAFRQPTISIFNKIITNISDNYIITERLEIIESLIMNYRVSGTLSARIKDNIISLNTFLENPFLGKGIIYSEDISTTGIGMHSYILDDLARYGLLGFGFELSVYILFIKLILRRIKTRIIRSLCISTILIFFMYSFFNSVVYPQTGFAFFFIFSLTCTNYEKISRTPIV